jgi:hypothetical protein
MWTTIGSVVTGPVLVTTVTLAVHAARVIWENLPAITLALRAAGAVLGVAAGIRALCHRRCDHHHSSRDTPDCENRR